jgi:hypothetical protein
MTCGHYNQTNKRWPDGYCGWRCKNCGANTRAPERSDEEMVAAVRGAATMTLDGGPPDLGSHAYREDWRKGTPEQEERHEAARCAELRDMERNGAKAKSLDGARHTHSIPRDIYWGAQRKYGKDVWKDKKFKRRFKDFKTTDAKD